MGALGRMKGHAVPAVMVIGSLLVSVGLIGPVGAVAEPSFVDATARITNRQNVRLGSLNYVAPFAILRAGTDAAHGITIGNESNVQDSVVVDATNGAIALGDMVILAHGATVRGNATLGQSGKCPEGRKHCPSFVGFNSEVDGAIIEMDAMVTHLARVAPGVTIPSGRKVLPGKNVASDAEVAAKTAPLVQGDRDFMDGVIEVNVAFAKEYPKLIAEDATNGTGINYDPGNTDFNPKRDLPTLAGQQTRDPAFRNRIIGAVTLTDSKSDLDKAMGSQISLRADEGEPFTVGTVASMGSNTTFHALEHTHLQLGSGGTYGKRSLVHGGPTPYGDDTISGSNLKLGDAAVFFRSRAGNNVTIGARSFIQESDLLNGAVVPDHTVLIGGVNVGTVEWDAAGEAPVPVTPAPTAPPAPTAAPPTVILPPPISAAPASSFVRRLGDG